MKTLNKENTNQNIPRPSTPNQISLKIVSARSQVSGANDEGIDMSAQEDLISRLSIDRTLEITPNVTDDIVENVAIDFFVLE